ncbi:MAG: sugar phosphate isomerase/epimerase [Candidatus Poribacteria bacterium]|nr:sugar phosphate isomerase/epimerase [Candidatus Poribacteria bacterium]
MFKIGVVSDEVSQDFQTVVDFATSFKLDSIEIRTVWGKPPQDLSETDIGEMKRILKGTNLKIAGIASPFLKCDIDNKNERREHLNILKRCINLAKALDTNLVRTFAFWKTDNTEERWPEIVAAYFEPVRIAEHEGVILGMENEHSTSLATAKLTERFVREIKSPNVRAIWDPANEAHADKDGEIPYPNAYHRLKTLMFHAHLKDALKNPVTGKIECVAVGEGTIDWLGQLQAFVDDGYRGHLCLETHWRPSLRIDDDQLNRPGGTAFSQGGEEASRHCMRNLRALIDRLHV